MIRFTLTCANAHRFDSWFANSAAYERLLAAGHIGCPDCGSVKVEKALMAPSIAKGGSGDAGTAPEAGAEPLDPRAAKLQELRRHIEETSDYVGMSFSAEARAMHEGRAPERAIYGEAKIEEAKSLIEDGIPVLPLPFITRRSSH